MESVLVDFTKSGLKVTHGKGYPHGCRCCACLEGRRRIVAKSNAKHRDKRAAYNKQYNKDNADWLGPLAAEWAKSNRHLTRAKHKRWRDRNAEQERDRVRDFFQSHPTYQDAYRKTERGRGLRSACLAKRRARIKAVKLDYAQESLIKMIYAHCPLGYEVDHILPIAKGGGHEPDNLQYLLSIENKKKGARLDYLPTSVIRWQDTLPSTTIPVTGVGASAPKRTEPDNVGL